MPVYTFITEYRKGTYICQKTANDLRTACFSWAADILKGGYIEHLDIQAFSNAFEADIDEMPPVPLETLQNVWLFHLLLGKYMLDLHIIQTDSSNVAAMLTATI